MESDTNFGYFKVYWPYYTVLKKENGEWRKMMQDYCSCSNVKCDLNLADAGPKDFSKSLSINEKWDQKTIDCNNEEDKLGKQAEAGIYMVSVEIPAYANNGFNVFYSNEFTIKEKTAEAPVDFCSCTEDSDCISVKADCCGCTAGGKAISINKAYLNEWLNKLGCKDIMCPAVMSGDPSCINKKPKCENNKCILK